MLVHGSNIAQKERHKRKYKDSTSQAYLAEIRAKYDQWHQANSELIGPKSKPEDSDKNMVTERVKLLEEYKVFIDQQKYAEHFDSRSNLHSTVMEEFVYYLFRDLAADFDDKALIGKSRSFKDIFFAPANYKAMTSRPHAMIERKDHDFVIGVKIQAQLHTMSLGEANQETGEKTEYLEAEIHQFDLPAVVIECKTYLDKTMLEGASKAAEELKARNPNALYIVIMEWIKLSKAVNLRKYKVDQIYVFRKQRNTDREFRFDPTYIKNPIDPESVWHLFESVRRHLTTDWENSLQHGLERGWLI